MNATPRTKFLPIRIPKTTQTAIIFLLPIVALLAVACGSSNSASDSEIIYSSVVDGSHDVFKVSGEDLGVSRLTGSAGTNTNPSWAPDKSQIAFLSDRNGPNALWVMDWAGESKRQISSPGTEIAAFEWAPDSVTVAVEIVEDSTHWIAIINTESGDVDPLTMQSEDVRLGGWSPDGEWVLYSMASTDSGIRRRNPNGVDEITVTTGSDTEPSWSRDGRWILFLRQEEGRSNIVVVDKDGNFEKLLLTPDFDASEPSWSPDSKHVAFVSGTGDEAEIYVIERDGKNLKQLTSNRVLDTSPTWSKNGSSIIFLSAVDGTADVYSMNSNGEQQKRMTSTSDAILFADW